MRKEILFGLKPKQISALLLVFISILCVNTRKAFASHAAGAELTFRYISTNSQGDIYEIKAAFYRDCFGVDAPVSLPIQIVSLDSNRTVTNQVLLMVGSGQEI